MTGKEGKRRQSSFELLRIISMVLVVVTHVDFYSLGWPVPGDMVSEPTRTIAKLFFESLAICCADVFVLISGWFGIKPTPTKFFRFVNQCFFFSFGFLLIALLLDWQTDSLVSEIKTSFLLRDYWFVISYILLFVLSPILNAFVESADMKTYLGVLCGFFVFEFIYGWRMNVNGFDSGYSTISFIGLYLIGRFLNKYPCRITEQKSSLYFFLFVLLCILNTLICILLLKNGRGVQKYFYYTSPFVILSSISLLLAFSKLEFYSSGVNYIASSALAVYLFHQNHSIVPGFKNTVIHLFNNNDALLFFCKISLFVLAIFVIAVLLDQVRKGFEYLFRKGYYALRGTNGKL